MAPTLISIQSHVVYGHVGNSAAVFPLQRLGCEVWPIHTVQFSSHAGYPDWRGRAFEAALIDECVAGLEAIGVLSRCDGVISGYLGKAEIGEATLARRTQRSGPRIRARGLLLRSRASATKGAASMSTPAVADFLRERAVPAAEVRHAQRFRTRVAHRPRRRLARRTARSAGAVARAWAQGRARHFAAARRRRPPTRST